MGQSNKEVENKTGLNINRIVDFRRQELSV